MKRRVVPILAVTFALVLFTGLAFAVDKKKEARPAVQPPECGSDEEALKAELLAASTEPSKKSPAASETGPRKVVAGGTEVRQVKSRAGR